MYKIIGSDQKEYGPVTADVLRQWIAQGRVVGQSMAQSEGGAEWKPLSTFPEFEEALRIASGPSGGPVPPPKMGQVNAEKLTEEILAGEIHVDLGRCLGLAWEILTNNLWPIIGVSAVVLLLLMLVNGAYVGILLNGPLLGGLWWYVLKLVRGQRGAMEDAFAGFTVDFLQTMLTSVVSSLLIGLGLIFCIVPGIYLAVAWTFALPLVMDKRLTFWDAMEVSRKVVNRCWWAVFGLVAVSALLNLGGTLVCCVGMFFTMPLTMLAMAVAYEDIFRPRAALLPPQLENPGPVPQ